MLAVLKTYVRVSAINLKLSLGKEVKIYEDMIISRWYGFLTTKSSLTVNIIKNYVVNKQIHRSKTGRKINNSCFGAHLTDMVISVKATNQYNKFARWQRKQRKHLKADKFFHMYYFASIYRNIYGCNLRCKLYMSLIFFFSLRLYN